MRTAEQGIWSRESRRCFRVWAFLAMALFASCESGDDSGDNSSALCCVVCETGKPCGDSCIAKDKTCTKDPGCACYGVSAGDSAPPEASAGPS